MHLCYLDESGTPEQPGTSSHYILVGLSIPDQYWKRHFVEVEAVKRRYGLEGSEVHVAWMMRPYPDQIAVPDFESLDWDTRRSEVLKRRNARKPSRPERKNLRKEEPFIHLSLGERKQLVLELSQLVSRWGVTRLFAECIDKEYFDSNITGTTVHEQALEQVVSRFERFLQNRNQGFGILIHDNNETLAKRHTQLMRSFIQRGTLWTDLRYVIETPMFVDSALTDMIQMADLCAYALRRYLERSETELFDLVFQRADRVGNTAVGVRHFTVPGCKCEICLAHSQ